MVNKLARSGILGPDFLLSHANNLPVGDIDSIRRAGAHISSTPLTELQMGHGDPVCLAKECYDIASLGVDCHSACSSSVVTQMMTVLQWQRGAQHAELERHNKWVPSNGPTVEDVYNLGTILGARAIGLGEELGSLRVGKKADIVIFNRSSPSMLVAADRDPVAAVVLHSSVRDVQTVIVDGVVRKHEGVLMDVFIPRTLGNSGQSDSRTVKWPEIAQAVQQSRQKIDVRIGNHINPDVMREGVLEGFHLNRAGLCCS